MEISRKNGDILVGLDSLGEARGLFAVLVNDPSMATPEEFERGRFIYQHFFHHVETLANNWAEENRILYHTVKQRRGV